MPWIEISFVVSADDADRYSTLCESVGAVSVSYLPAEEQAILEPKPGEMPLWDHLKVVALFEMGFDVAPVKQALLAQDAHLILHETHLDDQNWALTWKTHFQPKCYGDHLWIVPEDTDMQGFDNATCVHIAPGLAFGTGNHESTALCLTWLATHAPREHVVIDYGCGSGILALAALKLGARQVYAVDYDPQALAATESNASLNTYSGTIKTHTPETLPPVQADVLLANILAPTLISLAKTFMQHVKANGKIVLAGLLDEQADAVIAAFPTTCQFECLYRENGWVLLVGHLQPR